MSVLIHSVHNIYDSPFLLYLKVSNTPKITLVLLRITHWVFTPMVSRGELLGAHGILKEDLGCLF